MELYLSSGPLLIGVRSQLFQKSRQALLSFVPH